MWKTNWLLYRYLYRLGLIDLACYLIKISIQLEAKSGQSKGIQLSANDVVKSNFNNTQVKFRSSDDQVTIECKNY